MLPMQQEVVWYSQMYSCHLSYPLPIPQSGKGCLKLAGGRTYTVLGALT